MKVRIKDLSASMEIGNDGITLEVRDTSGKLRGDLRLGRGTVEWRGAGRSVQMDRRSWEETIAWFEDAT